VAGPVKAGLRRKTRTTKYRGRGTQGAVRRRYRRPPVGGAGPRVGRNGPEGEGETSARLCGRRGLPLASGFLASSAGIGCRWNSWRDHRCGGGSSSHGSGARQRGRRRAEFCSHVNHSSGPRQDPESVIQTAIQLRPTHVQVSERRVLGRSLKNQLYPVRP
jgi:hypothetical protein